MGVKGRHKRSDACIFPQILLPAKMSALVHVVHGLFVCDCFGTAQVDMTEKVSKLFWKR